MVAMLKARGEEKGRRLNYALEVMGGGEIGLDTLKKKIAFSKGKTTWLVADLLEGLTPHYPAPPAPSEFAVLATDGSHIDVDRHRSARCYLINIGFAVLQYGANPSADLDSLPRLCAEEEDLFITPAGGKGRQQPVEGTLLGIKRAVEECRQLARLATGLASESPVLALLDGSLILWGLEAYPDFVTEELLDRGFLAGVEELRKLNNGRKVALASYISLPRSTDVVNVLRVAICPHELVDCDRYCPAGKERECDAVAGVQDQELFSHLLGQGERSAVFLSQSSIVRKRYGASEICFFYLRVDDEVARVEVPRWLASDEHLLNLVHVLILDQCQRGQGYPVALSEAHEKAVVTTADRENFWRLVEALLSEECLPSHRSAKSWSKRTRWV
jgi:hypothetical protein